MEEDEKRRAADDPPPSSSSSSSSQSLGVELLPSAILATIFSKLDVLSICSAAATCKTFHACVSNLLYFLPNFLLLDTAVSIDLLRRLLPPNPYLRTLNVDCSRLNDSSIPLLVRPSLHELCLRECDDFSGLLLAEIGEKCRDLRSLSLESLGENKMHAIPISNLEKLLTGCPQLESLSLTFDISRFDGDGFPHIWAMVSQNLKVLRLGYISTETVTELLTFKVKLHKPSHHMQPSILPNLQKLQLFLVEGIADYVVGVISKVLISLTHLDLEDAPGTELDVTWDLTNAGLQQINRHRKLKHLSLVRGEELIFTYFRRVNDLGFLLMADACSTLESICLGGFCHVTDAGFQAVLHACSNLRKFTVCHGSKLSDLSFHDISATSLSLTHVGLRECNLLTNLAMLRLSCNKDLTLLDLRHCRNLGDEAMKSIAGLLKLKTLLLDGSNISDSGMSYMRRSVASLTSISVRMCKRLTDKCISTIFDSSFGRSLQVVDLSELPLISDNGILSIAKSGVPLLELRLRNCPLIGDTSIIALASMQAEGGWCASTLRLLDLYMCKGITLLAYKWFKKPYFPRLRWLGLTFWNKDIVDALAKTRPLLQISRQGEELGVSYWESDRLCMRDHDWDDEDDEWWLLDGESENDEEMVEDLID